MTCQTNCQDRIRVVLAKLLNKPVESIEASTRLADLGADSLDRVEIMMELEEEFGIAFDRDEEQAWDTISDIFKAVKERHG